MHRQQHHCVAETTAADVLADSSWTKLRSISIPIIDYVVDYTRVWRSISLRRQSVSGKAKQLAEKRICLPAGREDDSYCIMSCQCWTAAPLQRRPRRKMFLLTVTTTCSISFPRLTLLLLLLLIRTADGRATTIDENEVTVVVPQQQDEQWWSLEQAPEDPLSAYDEDSGFDNSGGTPPTRTSIRGQDTFDPPSSLWRRDRNDQQRHRSTLFFSLLCQLGLPSLCVCNGAGLQAALANAGGGTTVVAICPGVLQLDTDIDLSVVAPAAGGGSMQLEVVCGVLWTWWFESCTIDGRGITRLFTGAPKAPVSFRGITFQAGNGINEVGIFLACLIVRSFVPVSSFLHSQQRVIAFPLWIVSDDSSRRGVLPVGWKCHGDGLRIQRQSSRGLSPIRYTYTYV